MVHMLDQECLQHLEHGLVQKRPQQQEQKSEVNDLRNQERSIDS